MSNPLQRILARRKVRKAIDYAYDGDEINKGYERSNPNLSYSQIESIDNWRVSAISYIKERYNLQKHQFSEDDCIHLEYLLAVSNFAGMLRVKDISAIL